MKPMLAPLSLSVCTIESQLSEFILMHVCSDSDNAFWQYFNWLRLYLRKHSSEDAVRELAIALRSQETHTFDCASLHA